MVSDRRGLSVRTFQRYAGTQCEADATGRLHDFALDSMAFALEHCPFDAPTIVDSDQLALRKDYSLYLGGFLRDTDTVGMFVRIPRVEYAIDQRRSQLRGVGRVRPWEPVVRYFGKGEREFANWTFWPATVFTSQAARALSNPLDRARSFARRSSAHVRGPPKR